MHCIPKELKMMLCKIKPNQSSILKHECEYVMNALEKIVHMIYDNPRKKVLSKRPSKSKYELTRASLSHRQGVQVQKKLKVG